MLAGAVLESTDATGDACRQRYGANTAWLELTFRTAGPDDDGFFPVTDAVTTDGVRISRIILDDLTVQVEADTSDPAAISTWDASIAGVHALDPTT